MKTKTLVVVLAMVGLPLWAEDEEETEMVANALSNSQGVSYRVGNKAVLTSKGLVYRLDNNTYVGPDGIYTRLGKDWVTPSGLAARGSRGSYFGHGNGPSVKNGNGYITRGGYNYTSK
jgi:hypothetical protein